MEEGFNSFTEVKVAVPQYKNTPLQVKVLRPSKSTQNVLKVSKVKVLILQSGYCQCFTIIVLIIIIDILICKRYFNVVIGRGGASLNYFIHRKKNHQRLLIKETL